LEWSLEVNRIIKKMVHDVPPFPFVRQSLEQIQGKADPIVVSQTPCEALEREWAEHNVDKFVRVIAGQEMGTKTEHIAMAAAGQYDKEKILMIGDAPGDLKAAKGNEALFYPINPGGEEASWERFSNEALDKFFAGTYAGDYEAKLIAEFNGYLPEKATWQAN
jgi:phosphoglycolate phosphatase-like HAD superfamily hydrolase